MADEKRPQTPVLALPRTVGPYAVHMAKLGEGLYGYVLGGADLRTNALVAIKFIKLGERNVPGGPGEIRTDLAEFRHECRLAGSMGDVGVGPAVLLSGVVRAGDVDAAVSEPPLAWPPGGDLLGVIVMARCQRALDSFLPSRQMARFIRLAYMSAVERMLGAGVVHGDLEARNIMVDTDSDGRFRRLWIVDWGLAVRLDPKTNRAYLLARAMTDFDRGLEELSATKLKSKAYALLRLV